MTHATESRLKSYTLFSVQGESKSQEDYAIGKKERGLFVVADGFGGSVPGLQAAKSACESVLGFLEKEANDLEATLPFVLRSYFSLAGNVLFNALIHANRVVTDFNKKKGANEKGGTSLLACFLDEDLMALANVGNCSAWLIRDGKSKELVTPRSYARLTDPMSDNEDDPFRAVPLMAMGVSEDLEPEIIEFRVREGDWVILNTDGIPKSVREHLASNQLSTTESLEDYLSEQAYRENATLALLRF